MFLNNDGSGNRKQNISDAATTQFGTTTTTNSSPHVKSWAVGGTVADSNLRFDKRINRSLVPGGIEFSTMRAEAGGIYEVMLDGIGVFYMSAACRQRGRAARPRSRPRCSGTRRRPTPHGSRGRTAAPPM